jgi:hypothetical protein
MHHRSHFIHRIAATIASLIVLGIATASGATSDLESETWASDAESLSSVKLQNARAELLAAATAHNVALLVEADIATYPGTIDDSLLAKLVDEELPIGRENAEKWVSSLDDSALPLAKILRADHCMDAKHGCRELESCVFSGKPSSCLITGCGDGACKACWDIFGDLRKIVVKGWCSYTCQQGAAVVGMKMVLQVRIFKEFSACLPFSTPVP